MTRSRGRRPAVVVPALACACLAVACSRPAASTDPDRVGHADLVRRFVEADPGWLSTVLFTPALGDRWYCDVAPLGTADTGTTVYAWVTCETYVRTGQGIETGSGTALPAVFSLQPGPPASVQSFRAPSDATYADFVDALPRAVQQALEPDPDYVIPAGGDRRARATRDLTAGSPSR